MATVHIKDKTLEYIELENLLLDEHNPRFAEYVLGGTTQRDIVNIIVRQFGVDDVLSSIAVSGYFSAEPLVCKKLSDDKFVVVEGNRRLAAMLILANDTRAVDHGIRIDKYQTIHREHGKPEFTPVPAVVFTESDSQEALLSYLGVRHIVSTKQWDSFAKAAWVSQALKTSHLNLDDIAEMIGDNRGTIQRLLTGYHFVRQLEKTGNFNPDNSIRKGRGSNTKYPFSWVYTILGSPAAREFVGLSDDPTNEAPISVTKLENAVLLTTAMFGDSGQGKNPAIDDSRQLSQLAKVVGNVEKVAYLRDGKNVEDIERLTQPIADLLSSAMNETLESLREINNRIEEETILSKIALQLIKKSSAIKKQAENLHKHITQAATSESDDD